MDMGNFLEVMQKQACIEQILAKNPHAEKYGLTLSRADAELLAAERGRILNQEQIGRASCRERVFRMV